MILINVNKKKAQTKKNDVVRDNPLDDDEWNGPENEYNLFAPEELTPKEEDEQWVFKPDIQYTFLPDAPAPRPETIPIPPANLLGDAAVIPMTPTEEKNEQLSSFELVAESLYTKTPIRISYVTLDGMFQSERTVHPDYVYDADTNRKILVAWDELKNDWRAFAMENILKAKLMEIQQ
jgi:hypothetical protein